MVGYGSPMADTEKPSGRITPAERAKRKRAQKLADVEEEVKSGRLTRRQLTPEEMERHAQRREELRAQRRNRKS